MLTLTLVIPVYNEERHIKACLEAISRQTVMPNEVLVIDNNCTDKTIDMARQYGFVTIINEPKQGLIYARNTGFNAAKGEILGRIDADTVIDTNWVDEVKKSFTDPQTGGVTGPAVTSMIPYVNFIQTKLFPTVYFWAMAHIFSTQVMWGANMAIRKSAWDEVASLVTLDDKAVHEDQDLSLWISSKSTSIEFNPTMLMNTAGQVYKYPPKLLYYQKLLMSTKAIHTANGNLDKTPKLPRSSTLPGYLVSLLPVIYLLIVGTLTMPIDYLIQSSRKK
ncbi:MAG: glycosyltransferase involved in cell wall biosynthesis [Candidatus Saccharimonadales bacterium]|jgi:glycosyltransferase involved in cell wall biosynthesis